MNFCTSCKQDFASVDAFDAHRVGKHAFTYSEGIAMEPMREDGRRCLRQDEFSGRGLAQDGRGRWCLVAARDRLRAAFSGVTPMAEDGEEAA